MPFLLFFSLLSLLLGSCQSPSLPPSSPAQTWDSVLVQSRGQSLRMGMWQGDVQINAYMRQYVKPALKAQYDIDLEFTAVQGPEIVRLLQAENEANASTSSLDVVWINGETFFQLRQLDALWGPFTERLPHAAYVDWSDKLLSLDFQQAIGGYECPWGRVQFAWIYRSDLEAQPPRSLEALQIWLEQHPGRFTWPMDFTGMALLKTWLMAQDSSSWEGPFDAARYQAAWQKLRPKLDKMRPFLWKEGKSFPPSLAELHRLYAQGEVWFSMSHNDNEAISKAAQGLIPKASLAFVPEEGGIQNCHYLGIPQRSAKKAAAMLVINFLLSPEAQAKKLDLAVWGDGSVLSPRLLADSLRAPFEQALARRAALGGKALAEPSPEYLLSLSEDFKRWLRQ